MKEWREGLNEAGGVERWWEEYMEECIVGRKR